MRAAQLAFLVPALCLAQAPAQPRLVLDSAQHDFGQIAPGTRVSYRFKLSNAGEAPLTIVKLSPSCGCTSTVVGKDTLAPRESTELEVTFDSTGSVGLERKSVVVETNDPVNPAQVLTFQAEVLPVVSPASQVVLFQDLLPSEHRKTSVKLVGGTRAQLRVANVDLPAAPWLGVATREAGQDLWVDLDLAARSLPPSKLSGTATLTLHLINPGPSVAKLEVRWAKRPPVTAAPARLAWVEAAGQDYPLSLQLSQPEHRPFRILAARTSNPVFQVAPPSPRASARQDVQVVLSSTARPGNYEEKAYLTLDTPGHPELEIRLAAVLR